MKKRRRVVERSGVEEEEEEEEEEETRRGEGWRGGSDGALLWVVGQAGWWVFLGFKRILIKHTGDRYVG